MRTSFISLFLSCMALVSSAQHNIKDSVLSFPVIGITAAYQFPGEDLADRFGNNFNTGILFQWKFRNNWLIGIEGDYIFSDQVKENHILDNFKTPDGNIIDGKGQYATVLLYERGLNLELKGGKIFPVIGPNPNSGIMATVAIGYLQHKILIDTPGNPIPFLEGDYRKGYDRLSSGISFTEFLGYVNFGNKRLINFYGGFEFTQAFTKNRREINFDTGTRDTKSRVDMLFGLRLGWVFPLYKRMADKIYIN